MQTETPTPHGQGCMVWSNGIKYSGMWKDGLYHGQGEMKHENGGGYRGLWREGLRHGEGQSLYGGKWGYDKWEGHFKEDLADGSGTMHMANGTSETFVFEGGELAGTPPCNHEFEKAVFFRRLSPNTTDATIRSLLEQIADLDYCYIARYPDGTSMRIGRAKFKARACEEEDKVLEKNEQILTARQRAIDSAVAACEAFDYWEVDGEEIRVGGARAVDMKEYLRYGDY